MSGDRNPVRDRTLVLRVLVPSLEARLREKMKEAEEMTASKFAPGSNTTDFVSRETLVDLDGVLCEPTSDGSTRWNFHCDGATYPGKEHATQYESPLFVSRHFHQSTFGQFALSGGDSQDARPRHVLQIL